MTTASVAQSSPLAPRSPIDLKKLYLASAALPGRERTYFVGPFGHRVSFASQQRRALNVVWAVGQEGKLDGNPSVAVVGGGLAGLTTCAALIARKCRVTLIEAKDSVLDLQSNAAHRYVHPTVNFWPEKEIQPTTELPYLDWFEDRCMDVIETIKGECQDYFEASLAKFRRRTHVCGIESHAPKVKVTMRENVGRPNEAESDALFDLVFVTSGFGQEALLAQSDKSYWQKDGLEEDRDAGTNAFVIAGTGDGGMIEALRLVQTQFKKGTLCLTIIKEFDLHGLTVQVQLIEDDIRAAFADEAKAAEEYAKRYNALLDDIPKRTMDILRSRHQNLKVRLVGKLPAPFGLYVAPIHKLIMAAALADGAVEYVQGELAYEAGKYTIKKAGTEEELDDGTRVVVRVGPRHPLGTFLKDDEVTKLRDNQRATSDLLSPADIDPDFFPGFDAYPARSIDDLKFAKFRKKMVDDYLLKRYRNKSKLSVLLKPHYILVKDPSEPTFDGIPPSSLFGIELKHEDIVIGSEM